MPEKGKTNDMEKLSPKFQLKFDQIKNLIKQKLIRLNTLYLIDEI